MTKSQINKIATHPLQTYEWGEFRKKWGNEVLCTKYGIIIINRLPMGFGIGTFIKGPKPTSKMLADLKKLAGEHNLIFIKLEPNVKNNKSDIDLLKNNSAVRGKTLFTPTTFWINLAKSEEDLLKGFKTKTRYNIRYAQKQGVKVSVDNSKKAFDKYINLTRETVKRQGFYAHSERYHKLMWEYLSKAGIANLLVAKYKNKIITTWILFSWKDFLYYPYGASTDKHKNVMANNLLMWEAIKFGKKNKLKAFDLWGREPGKGFTKFKEGYNPEIVEFLGTWDLVINKPVYYLYRLADTFRWIILRTKPRFTRSSF